MSKSLEEQRVDTFLTWVMANRDVHSRTWADEIEPELRRQLSTLINQKEKEAKLSELENVMDEVSRGDWDWDNPDDFYEGFITHRIKQLKEELEGGE